MKYFSITGTAVFIVLVLLVFVYPKFNLIQQAGSSKEDILERDPSKSADVVTTATSIPSTAISSFKSVAEPKTTVLQEAGSISTSASPIWWLDSGAYLFTTDGINETIQGDLLSTDKWFKEYKKNNPTDTDGGAHPQNIFRLVNRGNYENFQQQAYFRITKQNLSKSDQRDAWSGLLLFNRYIDGNNLYYTGIRADGTAVIKSKKNGSYTTLAQTTIFPGVYDRTTNPTLLPQNTWIGIRSEVETLPDNSVSIKLYVDDTASGNWKLVTSVIDTKNPILGPHHAGIRTDFMDVQFKDYKIELL